MKCPNCGADSKDASKKARMSAKELVEALRLEGDLFQWCAEFCAKNAATWSAAWIQSELDTFRDRMRANGYRTNAGPVKDAEAAFRTHMRNAVKFSAGRNSGSMRPVKARVADKKDL